MNPIDVRRFLPLPNVPAVCRRAAALLCGLLLFPAADLAAAPPAASSSAGGPLSATENDQGVWITEAERRVLFYQRQRKSHDGHYGRENYVHPLYSLDGEVLSEDFPADHLHHRGIFWAWHQLWVGSQHAGDPWVAKDFAVDVQSVTVAQPKADAIALEIAGIWSSPAVTDADQQPLPLVREQTVIRVHRSDASTQRIDFEISLQALAAEVKLGGSEDAKGYGGFSVRTVLPAGTTFTARQGAVVPQIEAIDAGPWINIATERWGLAILTHRSNPGFPHPWILRQQRSMQNPAYPGREPITVPQDRPLVLRYQLILHRGQLTSTAIDRLEQEYQRQ